MTTDKLAWQGRVVSVQPRIRLLRSFDERSHSYLGYVLQIDGVISGEERTFTIGVGKGAYAKHAFQNGNQVSGGCAPASDPRNEPAEFYKVSQLKLLSSGPIPDKAPPPWQGIAPI